MQLTKQTKMVVTVILLLSIAFIIFHMTQEEDSLLPMTTQEKKARFISLIVPAINNVYANLITQYKDVKKATEEGQTNTVIKKLKIEYKVTTNKELLMALKPHPRSIALAQAAMESSWATSRFFKEANNIFGVWSFDENEPRIAALKKRGDKTIWVKKYSSIEESVYDYYRTLAKGRAYAKFRKAKMKTNDPFVLVTKLDRYSEKGSKYGKKLTSIIKFNKFDEYDKN